MSFDREQVLRAAAAVLTRRATASMDEIARAAGISRATLHRHFPGRDALVRALGTLGIEQTEECLDAARIEEGDPEEAVRRLIREAVPISGFLAFLYGENQLYDLPEMAEGWARIDERVGALFRRGQEAGRFRYDLTPAWLCEALYALIAASGWCVQDGKVAARDGARLVGDLLLGGMLREPA
ncbi:MULTISPECIES: TetR/AcrR family transcriptional regulator [Streptomycetaceae]|uniref:Putative paraquat resistance regulator n=1 Tax=Streptantibioticus cattleyicolor (strain ATCC 35852 / DSM 46488 / JCM 4925 / NBRC 14057 / NRRL 8057) TaxID=1003195 RepID=F8K3T4_STREN|nr:MULTISPECIES: TetR/AcrR family transcriptional regulator [Streptomycetaceae]AEW97623.1 putative paraquat resistance regulator [Streptantibioticus cattleyicolor NRRL 8057 = DSM 46488]MYS62052.1 TetR family transcriptional regulator [Streptomyces sp. SID5468]CCB77945.1 putative tetR-family transcriptional regulator [Streptantibioticus cattleyicolor NRRL 8057 = DSM 46488]